MHKLLTCFCLCPSNIFKRSKKKMKRPETADASTATDDLYMYGSMYELNQKLIMRSSIPSTCWTEVSNVDFTDDEALDHASTESLRRNEDIAAVKRSGAAGSVCEIVELSRSMSTSALEDTLVPYKPSQKISRSRHASNNF